MSKNEPLIKVNAFIDKDTEVKGDIRFKESFRIDGKFKGKILAGNTLIIGESAQVNADIEVRNISINGRVKGSIVARESTEIFSMGRVTGQIITGKLIVEEGAFFQGTCQMELKVLEEKKPDEDKPSEKQN
jgi:cytoskeletal protein CcmA (bactofilin family)